MYVHTGLIALQVQAIEFLSHFLKVYILYFLRYCLYIPYF